MGEDWIQNNKDNAESNRVYQNDSVSKIQGKKSRFSFLKKISIEPCIALMSLGGSLLGVQIATLYIQKTCKVGSFFFGNQTFSIEVRTQRRKQKILISFTF